MYPVQRIQVTMTDADGRRLKEEATPVGFVPGCLGACGVQSGLCPPCSTPSWSRPKTTNCLSAWGISAKLR